MQLFYDLNIICFYKNNSWIVRISMNQLVSDLLLPHVALLPELIEYETGFIRKPLNCNTAGRAEPV